MRDNPYWSTYEAYSYQLVVIVVPLQLVNDKCIRSHPSHRPDEGGTLGPVNSTDVSTNDNSPACWSLRLEPSCSPPFQGSRCVEAIWLYRIVLTTLQFAPLARR